MKMIWFDNMKKLKKSIFIINIVTFIYYTFSSFLSIIIVIDDFFCKLLGINTNFYHIFLYSYEVRKNPYSNNMRFNGLMEKYEQYHWCFVVYYKYFYPISITILILSVIGLIINFRTKNDNKYCPLKIFILILIIFITILITISNVYYIGWDEWNQVV